MGADRAQHLILEGRQVLMVMVACLLDSTCGGNAAELWHRLHKLDRLMCSMNLVARSFLNHCRRLSGIYITAYPSSLRCLTIPGARHC